MELVSLLINLVIGCLVIYCLFLLLNWVTSLMAIPAPIKTVILIIFAIVVILWAVGQIGSIPRIRL